MPDRQLLRDIRLVLLHRELRPVYAVAEDRHTVPNHADPLADFGSAGDASDDDHRDQSGR